MSIEAMKLALEALDIAQGILADARSYHRPKMLAAYTAIKQALAAPVQPVADAMNVVTEAMQKDPDYAWSWHCNIAMAFVDAGGDHYTGNQGAARFMKTLANVEPAHELPTPPAAQPAVQEFNCPRCGHVCAQRQWVWLSTAEEQEIKDRCTTVACVLRAVKAKLKEKRND